MAVPLLSFDFQVRIRQGCDGASAKAGALLDSGEASYTWISIGFAANITDTGWHVWAYSIRFMLGMPNPTNATKDPYQ